MAAAIAESWNPRQHRWQTTMVLLSLVLAGYMGNYFKLPIILHIDWLFGSIFSMLVVRLYGVGWGAIAAAIASSCTIWLWHHSSALILYTLEAVFVGWGLRRRSSNLLLLDVFYGVIIGFPLLWFLYVVVVKVPPQTVLFLQEGELDGIIEVVGELQDANVAAFSQEPIRLAEACELKQLRAFIQHYLA